MYWASFKKGWGRQNGLNLTLKFGNLLQIRQLKYCNDKKWSHFMLANYILLSDMIYQSKRVFLKKVTGKFLRVPPFSKRSRYGLSDVQSSS